MTQARQAAAARERAAEALRAVGRSIESRELAAQGAGERERERSGTARCRRRTGVPSHALDYCTVDAIASGRVPQAAGDRRGPLAGVQCNAASSKQCAESSVWFVARARATVSRLEGLGTDGEMLSRSAALGRAGQGRARRSRAGQW